MNALKRFLISAYKDLVELSWYTQALSVPAFNSKGLGRSKYTLPSLKTLVIVPHADDELIGCYQYMMANQADTVLFYCNFVGHNTSYSNRQTRRAEFISFADRHRLRYYLSEDDIKVESYLASIISTERPSRILLPSLIDWHEQHRLANKILLDALSNAEFTGDIEILWYNISVPMPARFISAIVPMDRLEYRRKWRAFRAHYPSQAHINVRRFKFVERHTDYGAFAAEPYCRVSTEAITRSTRKVEDCSGELDSLKNLLINYRKVYRAADHLYTTILG